MTDQEVAEAIAMGCLGWFRTETHRTDGEPPCTVWRNEDGETEAFAEGPDYFAPRNDPLHTEIVLDWLREQGWVVMLLLDSGSDHASVFLKKDGGSLEVEGATWKEAVCAAALESVKAPTRI